MDEHPDRTDVILDLLGKGQCLPHQPRNPLPQGGVQPFDIARQAAVFANSNMPLDRNHHIDVGLPIACIDAASGRQR